MKVDLPGRLEDGPTTWRVEGSRASVPAVRHRVVELLAASGAAELADTAALVVSELMTNVVLHAPGPAVITVAVSNRGLTLEVADGAPERPTPRRPGTGGTTGRGLGLVAQLAQAWGVRERGDGEPGKVVWCRLEPEAPTAGADAPAADDDLDALLRAFGEPLDEAPEALREWLVVDVGEAPAELVLHAKDHLDGLLREFALAEGRVGGALAEAVVQDITAAAERFGTVRRQVRAATTAAQEAGATRLHLRFRISADDAPEVVDAGEGYLRALGQADVHARDRRLLSLESPVSYRVLREWYVGNLIAGLRALLAERELPPMGSFEQSLLRALDSQDARLRESRLAAQLQQVTARLAAADSVDAIASIALETGMEVLGATGATLSRVEEDGTGRHARAVLELGNDRGLQSSHDDQAAADPRGRSPGGPSTAAISGVTAVILSSREEHDERFPHLIADAPGIVAVVAVPLLAGPAPVGALRFSWSTPRRLTEPERAYLDGLAAQSALAVARVQAMDQLKEAERRSSLLAQLGSVLATGVGSPEGLAQATLETVIPTLGDWGVVHLLDDRGTVLNAGSLHRDPALLPALTQLFDTFVVDASQPLGAGRVLATAETQDLPQVTEDMVRAVAPDDEAFVAGLLQLQVTSGACVPLLARGATVGVLSIARSGGPALTPADIAMLEDVGRRAGVAFDNARAVSTSVRLELALSAATVGSFEMRIPSGELIWDERLFRMLDVDQATFDGSLDGFFARVLPEDAERTGSAIAKAVDTVGELAVEYRVRHRDGSIRWLEGRGRALPGPDGSTTRLIGVAVDVTNAHDLSTQARRSLELMADGFLDVDREWCVRYANDQACRLTGRQRSELVGHDLWSTFPEVAGSAFEEHYRRAVSTGEPARFQARFDPLGVDVEVRAFPGPEGLQIYFTDVADRLSTERERDVALARLRLLNDVGADLTATLDVDDALSRLAYRMVPTLGDLISVDLSDEDSVLGARGVIIVAAEASRAERLREAEAVLPRRHNPGSAVHQVLQGAPVASVTVGADYLDNVAIDPQHLDIYRSIDMRYATVVPLAARGRVFGALSLIRTGAHAVAYSEEEVALALEIGRRAGLIVDNAAHYDAQRRVAEGLQRSLLPELPRVKGMRFGAVYEPSSSAAKVGGDWYDAFLLPEHGVGLVIGDVMGHDIAAAAAMGQLRSVLRTCAVDGDEPARVVDRLDRLVSTFAMADLATTIYARIVPLADGGADMHWANAGHPPPLLLVPGRPARFLTEGASVMIGVDVDVDAIREDARVLLPPGCTVLMFTDGLIERRGSDLDVGLERLRGEAERLHASADEPGALCQALLAAMRGSGASDDVALVAVTLDPHER